MAFLLVKETSVGPWYLFLNWPEVVFIKQKTWLGGAVFTLISVKMIGKNRQNLFSTIHGIFSSYDWWRVFILRKHQNKFHAQLAQPRASLFDTKIPSLKVGGGGSVNGGGSQQ